MTDQKKQYGMAPKAATKAVEKAVEAKSNDDFVPTKPVGSITFKVEGQEDFARVYLRPTTTKNGKTCLSGKGPDGVYYNVWMND
jgi:ribosomal protein S5